MRGSKLTLFSFTVWFVDIFFMIAGSVIEIGDKQLEFVDGPVAAPRRRCLPPTPGRPIQPMPPPKPQRAGICEEKTHNQVGTLFWNTVKQKGENFLFN